jgi:hypothetical protein
MPRPAFLLAEPENPQALSTRKLVVETAKFNVLTSHSATETFDALRVYPNVTAVVLVQGLPGMDPRDVARKIKAARPDLTLIYLSPNMNICQQADHNLTSHEPQALVDLLRAQFGDPRDLEDEAA